MSNPLVAQAPSGDGGLIVDTDGTARSLDGTGIFGDGAQTFQDLDKGGFTLGADLALDGLDLLGAVMDPLGTLFGAGIGWLIEHISFLHKGLDMLAGDPAAVTAIATTWENISQSLAHTSGGYKAATAKLEPNWQCTSAQGYYASANGYHQSIQAVSSEAHGASTLMNGAAALVGAERGLIRDTISAFVGELIAKAVVALATSWCSFGASVAAFITDTVIEGTALAGKIVSRIGKLAGKIAKLADKIGKEVPKLAKLAKILKNGAGKLQGAAKSASKAIGKRGAKLAHDNGGHGAKEMFDKSAKNFDKVNDWAKNKLNDHAGGLGDKIDNVGGNWGVKGGVYTGQSAGQQFAPRDDPTTAAQDDAAHQSHIDDVTVQAPAYQTPTPSTRNVAPGSPAWPGADPDQV